MGKDKKTPQTVTIDDKEYNVNELTQEQVAMVNHVADLDRKLSSAQFNLTQLQFGRDAFMNALTTSLKSNEAEVLDA